MTDAAADHVAEAEIAARRAQIAALRHARLLVEREGAADRRHAEDSER